MCFLYCAEYVHISQSIYTNNTKCDLGEMFAVVCGEEQLIYHLLAWYLLRILLSLDLNDTETWVEIVKAKTLRIPQNDIYAARWK